LNAKADAFVAGFSDELLEEGRQRSIRHGIGPERQIQIGIGALDVQRPKVRAFLASSDPTAKVGFTFNILPKWARRSASLHALVPVPFLKGILTAIPKTRGRHFGGRYARPVARKRRDLSARRNVCIRANRVCLQARMAEDADYMQVIVGAAPESKTEQVNFQVALRKSRKVGTGQ